MGVQVKFRGALQAENAGGVETSVAPATVYLLTSYLVLGVRGVLSWFTIYSKGNAGT